MGRIVARTARCGEPADKSAAFDAGAGIVKAIAQPAPESTGPMPLCPDLADAVAAAIAHAEGGGIGRNLRISGDGRCYFVKIERPPKFRLPRVT